jgi:hypothetical protein
LNATDSIQRRVGSDSAAPGSAKRTDWAGTALESAAGDLDDAHGGEGNDLTGLAEVVLEGGGMRVSSRRGHREPQARPGGWRARRRGVGSVDTVEEKTRNAVALCALLLSRDSERPSRAALTLAWDDKQHAFELADPLALSARSDTP